MDLVKRSKQISPFLLPLWSQGSVWFWAEPMKKNQAYSNSLGPRPNSQMLQGRLTHMFENVVRLLRRGPAPRSDKPRTDSSARH